MSRRLDEDCLQLIEELHEGKMLSHPAIRRHVDRALHTGDCSKLKEFIRKFPVFRIQAGRNIALARVQRLDNAFRPYPSRADAREYLSGPLKLGFVNEFDDMFGLHWDILCLPAIVPGRVGAGKSRLLKFLLSQILAEKRDFNVIIPDLKAEYRDLLTITQFLKVLTNKRVQINPLQVVPWMTPEEHILFFSKVFSRENWVGAVSENILNDEVEYLYRKRGIFDGGINYPTMKDLFNLITYRLANQKSFQFRDVLLKLQGRLKPYLLSKCFDCQIGIPYETWRTENVVLEMDRGFTDYMYCFISSFITGMNYEHNKKMGLTGSVLRTLMNADEGRILFAVRDVEVYGESYITQTITKSREFGLGYIVASPETASFNQTIKAISFLKVCFPLTDGNEKAAIKESFGLDDDQADYLFKLPQYGQAIVRYGGYEKPFILAVPDFPIKEHLTDEEVENRMSDFYSELEAKIKRIKDSGPIAEVITLPAAAVALLYFLAKEPFTKISEMTNAPGFHSPDTVRNTMDYLKDHGFIKEERYRTSRKGNWSKFAVLTEKAYKYLDMKGVAGKGGFEHKLYQHIIYVWHKKKEWKVRIEGRIKGSQKTIDVLANSKGHVNVCFEVTLHHENLISNIDKNIGAGASEVVVVTRDEKDMNKAIKMVSEDFTLNEKLDQITFRTIDEFFD